jgi:hypothetical protein
MNAGDKILQVGLEVAYGTDPVLAATKAFRAYDFNFVPLAGQTKDRTRAGTGSGAYPVAHLGTYQTITFKVDLSGSGAAGTPPLFGDALQMCNWSESIVEDTSVSYEVQEFSDAVAKSGAIYFNWGGIKHKLTGARGNTTSIWTPGDIPALQFDMAGLFNLAADAAFPDVEATIASWVEGVEFNDDNSTFSLFGVTPALQSATFNQGNQVKYTPRPNADAVRIPGLRQGGGSLAFECTTAAVKNWKDIAKANTLGACQLVHGKTAGNIVQLDYGKVQLLQPSYQDTDGDLYINSQIKLCRNPGGVEQKITVK